MDQKTAEQITTEFMKQIYGFCLKRSANLQDAEDLTQEICFRLYRALLARDDIGSIEGFVWAVARNAIANHHRGNQRSGIGAPMDKLLETWPSDDDVLGSVMRQSRNYWRSVRESKRDTGRNLTNSELRLFRRSWRPLPSTFTKCRATECSTFFMPMDGSSCIA